MGQARRRKLAGYVPPRREVDIIGVGFGGMCGECDVMHPPEPDPFIYTVGLSEDGYPELLLVALGATTEHVERLHMLLSRLAKLQRSRGRAFEDGEHVHGPQIDMGTCVELHEVEPSDDYPLGVATKRYGQDGYRIMCVSPLNAEAVAKIAGAHAAPHSAATH